ncbi:hypothetical protein [Pseudoalteromonas sp. SR41-4]|uniref:hypothetical protein n=1 Tax=Pseudoalteromonas sp. SR41-4 TaxID=2760950 RepID=UPI0015FF1F9F|nr:hypothetical protein [Pseudoalteromonas sp. SR41-4]MBB1295505.1 hypothetical protein [Pseudoalteromonas sp. SR41-4]
MARPARIIVPDENDPKVIELVGRYELALKKEFWVCVALLMGTLIIFGTLNFVPFMKPSFETAGSWLERSGALVGVMAMFIEFRSRYISNLLNNAVPQLPPSLFQQIYRYAKHESIIHKIVLFLGASGAVIWSYGSPILTGTQSLWQ